MTRPAPDYAPRACDCSFCRKHGAAWLADPEGRLRIHQHDDAALLRYRHGSGQAEFIACARCAVLMWVNYEVDGRLYAAINVRAVEGEPGFAPEQTASPQKLSAGEKPQRWQQLWFADVEWARGA